jgi:hypothetical protein
VSNRKIVQSTKTCIYCGNTENMTVDHIPPKALFPEPRPLNMMTVPCCRVCNESFSKDDEYFRLILVSCQSVSEDPAVQVVNEKLLRSIRKIEAPGLATLVNQSLHVVDVFSEGGIYLGYAPALKVDAIRFHRTLDRIAQGLFFLTHRYPIPKRYNLTCVFNNIQFNFPVKFIKPFRGLWKPPITIGNNIFSYSYFLSFDDPNGMLFIFWFYGRLYFYGHILPGEDIASEISVAKP